MSATMTLTGDWLQSIGNTSQTGGTGNLGTYATGGISVTPAMVGLGKIDSLIINPAGGYTFQYISSTGKVKAFAGTGGVAEHTHDLLLIGARAAATTNVSAVYTDVLGKEAASDVTIAGADSATKGGLGSASSSSGVEVSNSTNLSTVVFNWRATGR